MTDQEIINAAGALLSDPKRRCRNYYCKPGSDTFAEQERYCLLGSLEHVTKEFWGSRTSMAVFAKLFPNCEGPLRPGEFWDGMTDEEQNQLVDRMVNYRE